MASSLEIVAPQLHVCYHCGLESTESKFKYFDNKKADQPRHQCHNCHRLFTLGVHGRPQGKTYTKKRNVDPEELKSLSRQCRHCGVADNALFKYYNNRNLSQPRFKCLSCGKQFQMRVMGAGDERRLVHTSSSERAVPRRRRQPGVLAIEPAIEPPCRNYVSTSSSDDRYQYLPFDGSFLPAMPWIQNDAGLLNQKMSDEGAEHVRLLETENNYNTQCDDPLYGNNYNTQCDDPLSGMDDGNLWPLPLSGECSVFRDFLETELLTQENNGAPTIQNAATKSVDVNDYTQEEPRRTGNMEALDMDLFDNIVSEDDLRIDTVSGESTSSNANPDANYATVAEGMHYGAQVVGSPVAVGASDCNNNNDPSAMDPPCMSYAEAAAECCRVMDMQMEAEQRRRGDMKALDQVLDETEALYMVLYSNRVVNADDLCIETVSGESTSSNADAAHAEAWDYDAQVVMENPVAGVAASDCNDSEMDHPN